MAPTQSLVDLFETSAERHARLPLFGTKVHGHFRWVTYAEVAGEIARLRAGLASLGIGPGDRVAIISDNSRLWAEACYATAGRRAIFVPMYAAQSRDDWEYILRDSGAKLCLVGTRRIGEVIAAMRPSLPQLEHLLSLESNDSTLPFQSPDSRTLAPLTPERGDPAGFIYTSGTTGRPKGVVLTHESLTTNATGGAALFPLGPSDRSLSFLPWAHAFGQTADLHTLLHCGLAIAINDDISSLINNLSQVRPTVLIAVPRIFHRIYEMVLQKLRDRPRPIRILFEQGMAAARKHTQNLPLSAREKLVLLGCHSLLFSRIRRRFGGNLRFAISGSAALGREVAEFVSALGIQVYEGYGLTEASPIVAANCPAARRFGTVGRPLPGVTVTIDPSFGEEAGVGEILVAGPNVMQGYHQAPEETAQVLTSDGRLRTGDIGYIDQDGYLVVTGRIKEQYKLENGKYVAPAPLEEQLKTSKFIANCMLYGANRPQNVVLVFPEAAAISAHFQRVSPNSPASAKAVHSLLMAEVTELSKDFRSFERPRRILVLSEDFTIENGLLTPSLKLRRSAVVERYGSMIAALYGMGEASAE